MLGGGGWDGLVRMVVAADALERLLPGVEGDGDVFGDGGVTAMSWVDNVGVESRRSRSVELSGCMRAWKSGSEESEADDEVDGRVVSFAVIPMARSIGEQSSSNHAGCGIGKSWLDIGTGSFRRSGPYRSSVDGVRQIKELSEHFELDVYIID